MPLVMLCGFPSAGKTTLAAEIATGLRNAGLTVEVVSDVDTGYDPRAACHESLSEKSARGALKSAVERKLSRTTTVIVDSLNYIKGYRYELYCVARSLSTPSCVIHVATSELKSEERNNARDKPYTDELFKALLMRFEYPDARQRWDAPLFTIATDDKLPMEDIISALSASNAKRPNKATSNLPLASANSLHDIDRVSQQIISSLLKAQGNAIPGDLVTIPETTEKVKLKKKYTMIELRRTRQQFTTYIKSHPLETASSEQVATMFVQFLNQTGG